jgi:hypothetical protein
MFLSHVVMLFKLSSSSDTTNLTMTFEGKQDSNQMYPVVVANSFSYTLDLV